MASQQLLGQFTIDNDSKDFTIDDGGGADAVALTVGDYYIDTLCDHIETVMQGISGHGASTCSYSHTTGKVSFDFSSAGSTTIAWSDANLRDLLGYDGTETNPATTFTGTNEARYTWRPDRDMALHSGNYNRVWLPESMTRAYRSNDGSVYTVVGPSLNSAVIDWQYLDVSRVIIPATGATYIHFEQFFDDVIANGRVIKLYPDTTDSATYVTCLVMGDGEDGIGPIENFIQRTTSAFDNLWDVSLPIVDAS